MADEVTTKYLQDTRDGFIWVWSEALAKKPYMKLYSKRTVKKKKKKAKPVSRSQSRQKKTAQAKKR